MTTITITSHNGQSRTIGGIYNDQDAINYAQDKFNRTDNTSDLEFPETLEQAVAFIKFHHDATSVKVDHEA